MGSCGRPKFETMIILKTYEKIVIRSKLVKFVLFVFDDNILNQNEKRLCTGVGNFYHSMFNLLPLHGHNKIVRQPNEVYIH